MADQKQISWTEYAYANNPDFKFSLLPGMDKDQRHQGLVTDLLLDPQGNNVRWDRVKVLSRVYPRAIAGRVSKMEYNIESRSFLLEFSTKSRTGKNISSTDISEIVVPKWIYDKGYITTVQGATSLPTGSDDGVLYVRNDQASTSVRMKITPRE